MSAVAALAPPHTPQCRNAPATFITTPHVTSPLTQAGKGFNRDYWARFERFVKELTGAFGGARFRVRGWRGLYEEVGGGVLDGGLQAVAWAWLQQMEQGRMWRVSQHA